MGSGSLLLRQLPGFLDLFAFGMIAAYLLLWIRQRAAAALQLRYAFTVLRTG